MATHHTVESEQTVGDYYYYKPQWYSQAVDYPYLEKPLPRELAPVTPECEYIQPVSDKPCSPCYTYSPPAILTA